MGHDNEIERVDADGNMGYRESLARRTDLADSFGVVLTVPPHGRDDLGNWKYGLPSIGDESDPRILDDFRGDMNSIIHSSVANHVANRSSTCELLQKIDGHEYSVGPASQEWSKLFFELYRDARPVFTDGASLLAWGYLLKDVIKGIWKWAVTKEREAFGGEDNVIYTGVSLIPPMVFTGPSLAAVCYAHLCENYSISSDVELETYPRIGFPGYSDPDHPGGEESYLVRAKAGRRSFYYLVKGNGSVLEHFATEGRTLTAMPLPNLVGNPGDFQLGQTAPSTRVKIKSITSR
ncbi:MAG: hypothetical protein H0T91_00410 [Propionibacteriaceae bacterium]|nr:hypothetical protein [Propionibacteriaceae bacterium]